MAEQGNGADIAAVYQLLGTVAADVREHARRFDRIDGRLDRIDTRLDGVDKRIVDLDKRIDGLSQQVVNYHSSVLGHGIMLTDLEERVRRIEQHLNLPPKAAE